MLWPTEDQRSRSSNDVRSRPKADAPYTSLSGLVGDRAVQHIAPACRELFASQACETTRLRRGNALLSGICSRLSSSMATIS